MFHIWKAYSKRKSRYMFSCFWSIWLLSLAAKRERISLGLSSTAVSNASCPFVEEERCRQ